MTARISELNVLARAAAVLVGVRTTAEQRRRVRLFGGLVERAVEARPPIILFVHIAGAVLHADNCERRRNKRYELMSTKEK